MKTIERIILSLFTFGFLSCDFGPPPPETQGLGERLALEFRGWLQETIENTNSSGLSLAIFDKGQIIWKESMGKSNLETGESNNPDKLFHMASLSKTFVSLAMHRLENEGNLSLDDSLKAFFPKVMGTQLEKITLRNILTHSSGIIRDSILPLVPDRYDYRKSLEIALSSPLRFSPGERFSYSNVGIDILGLVIEAVTGEDFNFYMETAVLKELGMKGATFVSPNKNVVPGHLNGKPFKDYPMDNPSGGLVASLNHMITFLKSISEIYSGKQNSVWNKQDINNIRGYYNGDIGWPTNTFVGMGSLVDIPIPSSGPILSHLGGYYGFTSSFYYLPEEDIGGVLFSNNDYYPSGVNLSEILKNLLLKKNIRNLRIFEPEKTISKNNLIPVTRQNIPGNYLGEKGLLIINNQTEGKYVTVNNQGKMDEQLVTLEDRGDGYFYLSADFGNGRAKNEIRVLSNGIRKIIYLKEGLRYQMSFGTKASSVVFTPGWEGRYHLKMEENENPNLAQVIKQWLRRDDIVLKPYEDFVFVNFDTKIEGVPNSIPFVVSEENTLSSGSFGPIHIGETLKLFQVEDHWEIDFLGLRFRK